MTERIGKGVWVEIHDIVLEAGERAPQVPEDTAKVPLEMCVKGFLTEP
ncbi:MAG: 2-amino-4-ketopentanoate thiolase, partial [Gammaproteobacteria bacterium]